MSLRIACDLDGTLADMEGALQREAERLFGRGVDLRAPGRAMVEAAAEAETVPEAEGEERLLTGRETQLLWRHVRDIENFWTTLSEVEPGAVASLAAQAALHGWEVLFVTKRPATRGDTAQVQSQRWLAAHGFEHPSVYVMNGSRGKLADALELHAVVDDRPENCFDVKTDSSARPILVWREHGTPLLPVSRLGITIVHSFAEALELLQQMERSGRKHGFLGRMRAALGI